MRRVIYVIPYTSIIEQNAAIFRDILGDGNVLEHHSGVQFDLSDGAAPEEIRRALATENWDMPVVVTTAVQLFESLYANRSSRCRKLHNLANSVVIFDEAQMLPLAQLRPCVAAMASLAEQFRSTVVLCTATQPSLNDLLQSYAPELSVQELCPRSRTLYDRFRRVVFRRKGVLTDTEIAQRLAELPQALCIVNSRKAAQDIFRLLPEEGSFHLSTLMVPAQRQEILREIRRRYPRKNIWCFTGFRLDDELLTDGSYPRCEVTDALLACIDVLVDGRFVRELKDISLQFRGSRNQRVIDMNKTRETGTITIWDKLRR